MWSSSFRRVEDEVGMGGGGGGAKGHDFGVCLPNGQYDCPFWMPHLPPFRPLFPNVVCVECSEHLSRPRMCATLRNLSSAADSHSLCPFYAPPHPV